MRHKNIIYFRALNMNHEKVTWTKQPMTLTTAINYVNQRWGETAIVQKLQTGIEIIYNEKYKAFNINTNLSSKYIRR